MSLTDTLVYSAITLTPLLLAWVFRKRLIRTFWHSVTRMIVSDYFDEVEVKDAEGKKRVLKRPNEKLEALLAVYGPLSAAWVMEWARRNIKIKLPPLSLPEGVDLKQIGISALGTKVLAGKKLTLEDAIPLIIGYGKEYLEKSGIIEKVTQGLGVAGKPKPAAPAALSQEAQKIVDKALNP